MKKICITFAGVPGSSKTPITNYLSCKLNIPVFNNDAIRSEVIADVGSLVESELVRRRDERLQEIFQSGVSFILDASVDREWPKLSPILSGLGYTALIISLDLSREFVLELYKRKGVETEHVDQRLLEHEQFLQKFRDDVFIHISELQFPLRLQLSYQAVASYYKSS